MTATATLSNSTTQNVTSQATWQSSNQVVATVNSGLVTALQAGTVDITATYQNVNGSVRLTVPQPVVLIYTLSGTVTDGTSGGILPGIRMSITTGTNAGLSTTTDSTGQVFDLRNFRRLNDRLRTRHKLPDARQSRNCYRLNVRHRLTRSLQSAGEQSDKERRLIAGA